jgi:hypothetical protein
MLTLDTMAEKGEIDRTGDTLGQLLLDAGRELDRAVKLHPLWPDAFMDDCLGCVRKALDKARLRNDGVGGYESTAASIIGEELCEFYEAVLLGDAHKARRELVQVLAVLMRAYVHLPHYCGFNKATGGDACPTGERNG